MFLSHACRASSVPGGFAEKHKPHRDRTKGVNNHILIVHCTSCKFNFYSSNSSSSSSSSNESDSLSDSDSSSSSSSDSSDSSDGT